MKLILIDDVEKLGEVGDLVNVKDGYGRNFLIPQKKAVLATPGRIRTYEEEQKQAALRREMNQKEAEELAAKISEASVTIPVVSGEEGKIHGTITTRQIADALKEKDIVIDRRDITLGEEVKALGEYTATVTLTSEINAELKVWVVKAES